MTTTRFRQVQVFDAQGFGQPIPTRSFLAPSDWSVEGGAFWNPTTCLMDLVEERFQITSPDGHAFLTRMPPFRWQWAEGPWAQGAITSQGCRFGPPMTAGEVLERFVAPSFTGGPVGSRATHHAGRAQAAREREMARPSHARVVQSGGRVEADAADLQFVHAGRQEHLQMTVVAVILPGPMGTHMALVGEDVWRISTSPAAAPDTLDLIATMLGSMRVNPAWEQAATARANQFAAMQREHSARMHDITMQGIANMGAITARQNDWLKHVKIQDTSSAQDALHTSWMRQNETSDRIARTTSEGIREVDAWRVPGGFVELPMGYDRAFTNGQGEYVVSNDPSFDPARLDGTWTSLNRPSLSAVR